MFFFVDYQGSRFDTPATPSPVSTFTAQDALGNLSDIPGITLHYPGTNVPMPANLSQANINGRPTGSLAHSQVHAVYGFVFLWRGGKVARVTVYTDPREARAAAERLAHERA